MLTDSIIIPDWPAPKYIRSVQSIRSGGYSQAPFDSFNLAEHVGDDSDDVQKNRQNLLKILPSEPIWLNQVHSNKIIRAENSTNLTADGSYSAQTNVVSVVMTADCLPLLMCNRQGTVVAAVHAGWRGLVNGIIEQAVKKILIAGQCRPEDLYIWLGPAIGAQHFEVGAEVRAEFLEKSPVKMDTMQCFMPSVEKYKWLADIYQLARQRLSSVGVENVFGGAYCTYNDKEQFYSYRRNGKTGRMASLIWIE